MPALFQKLHWDKQDVINGSAEGEANRHTDNYVKLTSTLLQKRRPGGMKAPNGNYNEDTNEEHFQVPEKTSAQGKAGVSRTWWLSNQMEPKKERPAAQAAL